MCNRHAVISSVATNVDSSAHVHKPTNGYVECWWYNHPVYATAIELNGLTPATITKLLTASLTAIDITNHRFIYECTVYVLLNFILRNYDDY